MPDLASGQLGAETTYDVAFTGGALAITAKYTGAQATFALTGTISAAALVGALAAKVTNATEKELLIGLETIIAAIP